MSQKIPIRKFSFRILLFSAVVAALTVIFQWLCPEYASPALPFIVLFFLVITLFSLYIVLRDSGGKEGKRFVSNYMLSRVVKLLSCLLFLVLYMVLNKEDAWRFAIAFLIIYFMYAIVEVVVLKKENEEIGRREESK